MCKKYICLAFFLAFCTTAMGDVICDIAFYVGAPNPGWYDAAQMNTDVATIIAQAGHMFNDVQQFDDNQLTELGTWVDNNTNDGEMDILWLNGCMPSVLYPLANASPDGSRAEEWLDGGNMIINIGDWFAYCTYEGGTRGGPGGAADNGSAGAGNVLDLAAGVIASSDGLRLPVTAAGYKYLPSLSLNDPFPTDRPVILSNVVAPWEVGDIFAGNATQADPIVIHNTATDGYVAFINQATAADDSIDDRGVTCSEFIINWVGSLDQARNPDPPDGTIGWESPLFMWTSGKGAKFHDIYFGTNPTPGTAEYKGRQPVAWNMYFSVDPLVPGTTYYWRIDEVEADGITINTGEVWSVVVLGYKAIMPDPPDGAEDIWLGGTELTWIAGKDAGSHDVYFGSDETAVTNGTGGTFKGNQTDLLYDTGPLEVETTYYWRIDEHEGTNVHTGDVWEFTTTKRGPGGAIYRWYSGFGGVLISDLTSNPAFPDNPTGTQLVPDFEGPVDWADNYGVQMYGWLYPPGTGDYTFWIATDDAGELRLSTDDDPANATLICSVEGWVPSRDWDGTGGGVPGTNQMSSPVALEAGKIYYIEGLMKEAGGGDNISAAWQGPGIPTRELITGEYVAPTPYPPVRASTPTPIDGAVNVADIPTLEWMPGALATQHDVYLGTDAAAVAAADTATTGIYRTRQATTTYTTEPLEWGETYYWKVNELNLPDIWEGHVWSFTVAEYIVIDNFEDYNDYCDRIFYTWVDGWGHNGDVACGVPPSTGNGTGSTVGYLQEPYAEQTITHDGSFQSMPFEFLNDGSTGKARYSETERTFDPPQDWTRRGAAALSLWFRGLPGSPNGFDYDAVSDVYTVTARSGDIWGNTDSFHYVYKRLSGPGSIQAKIVDVTAGAAAWTKVGVMIREDLDPNSPHAFSMLTPPGRTALQHRAQRGQRSYSAHSDEGKITYPYWVKIERTGNNFTAYYSSNGTTWVPQPNDENLDPDTTASNPANIPMNSNTYIGLALCSNNVNATVHAHLSDVSTTGTVTGQWQSQDIGIASNAAEQLYVVVEDSVGKSKVLEHPDPNATQLDTWQEWNIDLTEAGDAGVNLQSVKKMYIGVGNRDFPTLGGGGMLYIDDIRLYRPRCVPSMLKPDADIAEPYDCKVDCRDLEILTHEWLFETPLQVWEYRAAYWDARYVGAWGGDGVAMRDGLAAAGYTILDADQLKTWMNARIADGKTSVVVFCLDIVPDTVCETMSDTCTLRKYLDAGGKIVWYADIPMYYVGYADGTTTTWGDAGAPAILGFNTSSAPRDTFNDVAITGLGVSWGLTQTWQSQRPAAAGITTNLTVLATDDAGNAPAWAKHFVTGDRARGFVRIWDTTGTPPVADVISVAESSGALAADLYEDRTVDFKDYAVLADSWLEEAVWP